VRSAFLEPYLKKNNQVNYQTPLPLHREVIQTLSFTMPGKASENTFSTALGEGMGALLSSGKYSDLTIQCGDNIWNVHKMVMCTLSAFFSRPVMANSRFVKSFHYLSIVTVQDATMLRYDHLMGSIIKQLSSLVISCSFQRILTSCSCRRRNLARSNFQMTSHWS
jgi:BTB/POZ domain